MRVLMSNWQQELANGFKNANDLLDFLQINNELSSSEAEKAFKTKVPMSFAKRMQKGDPVDPLLLQVLAQSIEMHEVSGFSEDPLQEASFNPIPGVIHKYYNRVLLVLSGACAVHCRYCFRRHFSYHENNPGREGWGHIQDYLIQHPEVEEVILSGGDPLLLPNQSFKTLLALLSAVPHIKTVRIHSRIPIVLPSRIETEWLELWKPYPWKKVMVTHANHAQELNQEVGDAVHQLKCKDWTLLNQAVLLTGVNDDVEAQVQLSERLFHYGILPYYLHLLDAVKGAAHFAMPLSRALDLYQGMQSRLSGYLLPRLVQEKPGKRHKTLVKC